MLTPLCGPTDPDQFGHSTLPPTNPKIKNRPRWERLCQESSRMAYFLGRSILYFLLKRSTRPAVSTNCCLPVKKGWLALEISTSCIGYSLPSSYLIVCRVSRVDLVRNNLPVAMSLKT